MILLLHRSCSLTLTLSLCDIHEKQSILNNFISLKCVYRTDLLSMLSTSILSLRSFRNPIYILYFKCIWFKSHVVIYYVYLILSLLSLKRLHRFTKSRKCAIAFVHTCCKANTPASPKFIFFPFCLFYSFLYKSSFHQSIYSTSLPELTHLDGEGNRMSDAAHTYRRYDAYLVLKKINFSRKSFVKTKFSLICSLSYHLHELSR